MLTAAEREDVAPIDYQSTGRTRTSLGGYADGAAPIRPDTDTGFGVVPGGVDFGGF